MAKDKDDSIGAGAIVGITFGVAAVIASIYLLATKTGSDNGDGSGLGNGSGSDTATGSSKTSPQNWSTTALSNTQQNLNTFSSLPTATEVGTDALARGTEQVKQQANTLQNQSSNSETDQNFKKIMYSGRPQILEGGIESDEIKPEFVETVKKMSIKELKQLKTFLENIDPREVRMYQETINAEKEIVDKQIEENGKSFFSSFSFGSKDKSPTSSTQSSNVTSLASGNLEGLKTNNSDKNVSDTEESVSDTSTLSREGQDSMPIVAAPQPIQEAEKKENYKYKNITSEDFTTQMKDKTIDELKEIQGYLEQKFNEKKDAESKMSKFSWGNLNPNRTKASEVESHLNIVEGLIDGKEEYPDNPDENKFNSSEDVKEGRNALENTSVNYDVSEEFKPNRLNKKSNTPNPSSVLGTASNIKEGLYKRGQQVSNNLQSANKINNDSEAFRNLAAEKNKKLQRQKDAGFMGAMGFYGGGRRRTRGRKRSRKTRRKGRKQTKRIYVIENMTL